ncbi:MAG: prepilin-type N-terminal cleavage/methylation domain-containing protein [Armatimonadota bacterium]
MTKLKKHIKNGFTLVELLVVIVILAILASIALPKFLGHTQRGKESKLASDLKTIRSAVDAFYADTGYLPVKLNDLASNTAPTQARDNTGNLVSLDPSDWHGPYLESIPKDPFLNANYAYIINGPELGKVKSLSNRIGSNGVAYSQW